MDLWDISKLSSAAKCLLITPVRLGGRPIVPLKMGYLRWPTLVINAVAPLDVSKGLEFPMATGPWGEEGLGHSTGRVGSLNVNPPAKCRSSSFH